jgi:protein involved in polysaccharide export with SLBB domain
MFSKAFLIDAVERVAWTAIQAFAATWIVNAAANLELPFVDQLKVAGTAALLAACKAIVATKVGDSGTAQALPGVESTYVNQPAQ